MSCQQLDLSRFLPPDWVGYKKGRFSNKSRTMTIQVAVPENLVNNEDPMAFIIESIKQATNMASTIFEKAKVEFRSDDIISKLDDSSS